LREAAPSEVARSDVTIIQGVELTLAREGAYAAGMKALVTVLVLVLAAQQVGAHSTRRIAIGRAAG